MALLSARPGPNLSKRHEIYYLGESTVGAVRIDDYKYRFIDQPEGWLGAKVHTDVPYLINLRLDPFERQGWPNNGTKGGAQAILRLVQVPILAFCIRPADDGERTPDISRFPADAKGRKLQP